MEGMRPSDFFKDRTGWEAPELAGTDPVKLYDGEFRYRGFYDKEPEAVCRARLFDRGNGTPVLVLSEEPDNPSTSITNAMEFLAPEAIRHFCPERFEWEEPIVLLEHYPAEYDKRGRAGEEGNLGPRQLPVVGTQAGLDGRPGAPQRRGARLAGHVARGGGGPDRGGGCRKTREAGQEAGR